MLATDGSQLWNIEAVQMPDTLVPIPSDFDLSSAVTARLAPARALDPRVLPSAPPLVRQAATYLVSESGPLFSVAELHAARDHFMARRASLTDVLAEVPIDDAGRANLVAHVDAFYTALARLDEIMAAVR